MTKKNKISLSILAKQLGTKIRLSEKTTGEYVRYNMKHIKGLVYEDGTGGINLKVPGLDFFISGDEMLSQVAEVEKRIAAYKALESDLKKLKRALLKSESKIPVKPPKHGESNVSKRSKRAG